MVIEDSYSGPSLEADGSVTVQFTTELLAHLKSQKVSFPILLNNHAPILLSTHPSVFRCYIEDMRMIF